MRARFVAVGIVLALVACDAADPTSFDRVRASAEVVVAVSPGGGLGGTGSGPIASVPAGIPNNRPGFAPGLFSSATAAFRHALV